MKTIRQLTFSILTMCFIFSSCNVEKRVYMSGYHIEWKKCHKKIQEQNNDATSESFQLAADKEIMAAVACVVSEDTQTTLKREDKKSGGIPKQIVRTVKSTVLNVTNSNRENTKTSNVSQADEKAGQVQSAIGLLIRVLICAVIFILILTAIALLL